MITTSSYANGRTAGFAMSSHQCADTSWLRALPEFKGEVSVLGTPMAVGAVNGGVRITADVRTFPGTTAWSPPT